MTNMKSTKRALLLSVVALLLCFTMLMGTTYAWFTDSVTSTGNKIVAGNLDIDLYMWTAADASTEITNESAPIFGAGALAQNNAAETLWEPGKTQTVYLSIKNNGTLALKYQVALEVKNVEKDLIDVMQYAITPDAKFDEVTAWDATLGTYVVEGINLTKVVTAAATNEVMDVVLEMGAEHFFDLSVHMDEVAGNDYQGGSVDFDIKVLASQLNSEEDSFGPDYDKDATYPVVSNTVAIPDSATESVSLKTTAKNSADENVTATEITLTPELLNSLPAEVKTVETKHSTPVVDTANKTVTFDSIELVDQDGNIIDLETLGNDKELTVKIYVGDAFAEGETVTVYHNGTELAREVVDAEGYVTYTTTHFCEVKVVEYVAPPTGTVNNAYTSNYGFWGDWGGNAKESFVIEIYSGDTYLGSTSLNNVGGIIDGDLFVTWSMLISGENTDEYWTMEWKEAPTLEKMPTHATLVIDGVKIGSSEIQLNGPDGINKLTVVVTDTDGRIIGFARNITEAFTMGGNITLLEDQNLNDSIVVPAN